MDNTLKKLILNKVLPLFLIGFIIVIIYYYRQDTKNMSNILSHVLDEKPIKFNYESGFYDKNINLELKLDSAFPSGTKIYYTLNGNNSNKDSEEYKGKIELKLDENTKVYPIKAIAYYKGEYSDIYYGTYILDKDIKNNDISIISITSDEKNLYDYEKGILVKGKTYDEAKKTDPNTKRGNYNNRGDEWIRGANILFLDNSGDKLIEKNIGLAVSGGSSAAIDPKSFKIIANYKNDEKFNILFDNLNISNYSMVNTYNSLRLRGGSQDSYSGNIRSSLVSKLCDLSSFDGCSTTKRAQLYLNGKFYGVFDVQQNYSSSFLARKYMISNSDSIDKIKGTERSVLNSKKLTEFFNNNLDEKEDRKKLEEKIDIDNFLLYYSIQILLNNTDFPQNNFEMWHYSGDKSDNKYTDGKYRFLLFDVDTSYYETKSAEWTVGDIFEFIMENKYRATDSVFKNFINSKYYRDKYIMLTQDLLNTSFSEDNILKIVDEEYNKINESYRKYYSEKEYNNFNLKIKEMKEKIKERDDSLLNLFKKYFNLDKIHKVNIKSNEGIQINFTNQELYQNNTYSNDYYVDIDLTYNYKLYPGYKFKYWLVNGEKIYDEELVISDKYKNMEEISIEAVAEYDDTQNQLIISEISAKDDSDWIKLTNIGKEDIKLKDYYLSDNEVKKYQLPNIKLKSNESIIINGNKNYYSIGNYICNFNLSTGETLTLFYDDSIIDKLYVPRMSSIETYGRYVNSNTYKFFMNDNNQRKESTY